jgi:exopolysaccharide production protein ExoZ
MVVYIHSSESAFTATGSFGLLPPRLGMLGLAGVDIFFVISGVIIASTARGLTWREFVWRRFRRIMPMYWLTSILFLPIASKFGYVFDWRGFIATCFLWPATDKMSYPALEVAWTLCFEMLFYIAATLVMVNIRLLIPLIGIFVLAVALREHGPLFQFLGNPLIIEFFFGVISAFIPRWRPAVWCLPIGVAGLVAVGLLGAAVPAGGIYALIGDDNARRLLVYGVPSTFIVLGTMQFEARPSVWTVLGDASYTLYLTHRLVISFFFVLWSAYPIPSALIDVIGIGASVLFAWRVYVLFEVPLLNFFGRSMANRHIEGAGYSRTGSSLWPVGWRDSRPRWPNASDDGRPPTASPTNLPVLIASEEGSLD